MTINEFRAFLEGMDIQEAPTPEQWARIVAKVAVLHETVQTQPLQLPQWTPDKITCQPVFGPSNSYGQGTGDPMPEQNKTWCIT